MKEKGIKIVISIILFASTLMPFSVHADTYITTSNVVGCHISEQYPVDSNFYNVITCNLDGMYQGTAKMTFKYRTNGNTDLYADRFVSVSGNEFNVEITTANASMNTGYLITVSSITSNNIVKLSDMSSVIVNDFPIESYTTVAYMYDQGFEVTGFVDDYYYSYPAFKTDVSKNIASVTVGANGEDEWCMIIGMNNIYISNLSRFDTLFTYSPYITFYDLETLYVSSAYRIIKIKFRNDTSSNVVNSIKYKNNDDIIVPIYINRTSNTKLSTDFALVYGFSNQLLNDLHIIASGNQATSSAASDLESANTDMATDMNSMATIENGYSQDFNSQLQNIDFTNPIQQNQGILPAANFVISIFNGLISSNPFSVLIVIVCILLIGKKVIGK